MRMLVVSALLAQLASHASATMMQPRVVVRAEIATPRINDEFETEQERKEFLRRLERKVAAEASKIRCFEWQPWQQGGPVSGPQPQAELWVRLIDHGSLKGPPQILLTYAGSYDLKAKRKELRPLPKHFERVLMEGYAGALPLLEHNFNIAVADQFGEESFEVQFNEHFIANVAIAERLEFVEIKKEKGWERAVIVPVAAERMSLATGASLRVLLKRAPICGGLEEDCSLAFTSKGTWYDKGLEGALRCSFPPKEADCCYPLAWSDLKNGTARAERRKVLLDSHRHCSSCWGSDGLYRHPEAP